MCLNFTVDGMRSGNGFTSDSVAACNDEVACTTLIKDGKTSCNVDWAIAATCADPLHPRYDGGTVCKSLTASEQEGGKDDEDYDEIDMSCPAVKDVYNVAVQTCLEADNNCASAWTAYKALPENDATDCVTDPTKTCHPKLASAAEMYTSGSPAAIEEAIFDPLTGPEMSTVLSCFYASPDASGCMMRELYEVDFNDESKSESFWAATTCNTDPDSPVPISQLLMPGFSCQPDACAKISACSLCKPAAAPTDTDVTPTTLTTDSPYSVEEVLAMMDAAMTAAGMDNATILLLNGVFATMDLTALVGPNWASGPRHLLDDESVAETLESSGADLDAIKALFPAVTSEASAAVAAATACAATALAAVACFAFF